MIRRIALVVIASASLFLAACATSAPQRPPESAVDQTYVHTVEHHARRAGVRVEWVNPPRIRDRQSN